MKIYQRLDTPYITVEHLTYSFVTEAWTLANPDTGYPKITISDANGVVKVNAVTMTSTATTGKFEFQYIVNSTKGLPADAALGDWSGYIAVQNNAFPDREFFAFKVE